MFDLVHYLTSSGRFSWWGNLAAVLPHAQIMPKFDRREAVLFQPLLVQGKAPNADSDSVQ